MNIKLKNISMINVLKPICKHIVASNAADFKSSVWTSLDLSKAYIINLKDVELMDSAGLGVLISCLRKVEEADGKLVLLGLKPSVQTLFEVVRLNQVFEIYENTEEAMLAFAA